MEFEKDGLGEEDNTIHPIEVQEEKEETAEDAFAEFERTTAASDPKKENFSLNTEITIEDEMKVNMFLSFGCYLLSGFHAFLYSKMAGFDISTDELILSDAEKKLIEPLMMDVKIIKWLNEIHPAVWVILQIEYIYFLKFRSIKKMRQLKAE